MDPNYKQLRGVADNLHHKFQDVCDDRNNTAAQNIMSQGREVTEDIESNRDPRAVEDRIKRIQEALRRMKSQPETPISYGDIDSLYDGYERLRESLRKLPNY